MATANTLQVSILHVKHTIVLMLVVSLLVPVSESRGSCFPRCRLGSICCMGVCEVTSCQGHSCVTSSDCSWGETCCSSQCAAESGCVGRRCTHDYDCDVGEKCCLDVCTDTEKCSCDHDSECPIGENCCHGSCSEKRNCSVNRHKNATLVIIGSVLGSLVLISLISIVIYLIYRRRHRNIHRTGSIQTVPVSVATPNINTAQNVPTTHAAERHASLDSLDKLNALQNDYGAIPSHQIYKSH